MKRLTSLLQRGVFLLGVFVLFSTQACEKAGTPAPLAGGSATASPAATGTAIAKTGPLSVCYIEVNNYSIADVGKYTLTKTGANVFDIGIIFAANINYDVPSQHAVLYFNPQVTSSLNNTAAIQKLQSKGIKVLLSVLGNHQGAGISNFPTQAAATDFARQLANAVTTYGLDGIDFDDEYADYGTNNTGAANSSSFVYLVTALRQLMPSKLITFYFIGPASTSLSYNGVTVGSKVNYSWNPNYGTYSAPAVPGLTKAQLGPAAIDITTTSTTVAMTLAQRTILDGYGIYLCYNLTDADTHTYMNSVTNTLYKDTTVYTP